MNPGVRGCDPQPADAASAGTGTYGGAIRRQCADQRSEWYGKEVLARYPQSQPESEKPFIAINCGALPEQLLESELFGHAKGAFTGAVSSREGLFQAAESGTLFLDEIGDMPMPLQVKLLRVLQERKVRPLGSNRDIDIDVRVISATHRDLPKAMENTNSVKISTTASMWLT